MKYRLCMHLRYVFILAGIACAGMPDNARACNVPVFRYAMERWPADLYQILVYHRTGPQGAAFELLREHVADRDGAANFSLKSVDVTKPEGKALAKQRGIFEYPWVEIYYPIQSRVSTRAWSGPLTLDGAKKILDSPARSRLVQGLLGGDVAVWILIRSSDDQKDRRALESLKSNLDWASETLRIPESGVDVNGNPIEVTDFKAYPVSFGLIEIAHNDPEENLLVSTLLESEPDLGRYDEPIAFPVFGKGRALYALVGDGIRTRNIREACESMLGWCSCEIKDLSPGTDLLISANWSQPFGGRLVKDPELPLTGLGGFVENQLPAESLVQQCTREPAAPVASSNAAPAGGGSGAVPTGAPARVPNPGESPVVRNVIHLAGVAGLIILALSLWLKVKARG